MSPHVVSRRYQWSLPRQPGFVNLVSSRYHLPVRPSDDLYPLIERLSNLLRGGLRSEGAPRELEPVHLQALDYLARANDYSNTPVGVAEYLGLTKGNVSQRLLALERDGYLRRLPDRRDGRISHLVPTAWARALLARTVPPPGWRQAIDALPAASREPLAQGLRQLLSALQQAHGRRSFGVCRSCRFFTSLQDRNLCGLTGDVLHDEQAAKICREHEPVAAGAG